MHDFNKWFTIAICYDDKHQWCQFGMTPFLEEVKSILLPSSIHCAATTFCNVFFASRICQGFSGGVVSARAPDNPRSSGAMRPLPACFFTCGYASQGHFFLVAGQLSQKVSLLLLPWRLAVDLFVAMGEEAGGAAEAVTIEDFASTIEAVICPWAFFILWVCIQE
jgi:hypothetical protein